MIFVPDNGLSFRAELDIHHDKHKGEACRKILCISQAVKDKELEDILVDLLQIGFGVHSDQISCSSYRDLTQAGAGIE